MIANIYLMIDDGKQEDLKKSCFLKMANATLSDKEIHDIVEHMKQHIYDDKDFRHRYSDFFKWVADVYADDVKIKDPSQLGENIAKLSAAVKSEYKSIPSRPADQQSEIKRKLGNIEKFCDHLNLSLAEHEYNRATLSKLSSSTDAISLLQSKTEEMQSRANEIQSKSNEIQSKTEELQSKTKKIQNTLKNATKLLNENDKKVKSLQLEFITILSIFAAIVIATAGGFSYITAAVASLDSEIPLHRTICVIAIAGFFLFNSIFILLYIISKIADKPIYTCCKKYDFQEKGKSIDTKNCQSCKNSCYFFIKLHRRLPYVFWFNVGTAIILLIVLIRWLFIYHVFQCFF